MYPNPDINPEILVAVAKVVIAIAWADGEIQEVEKACIKAMLSEVPDLSDEHIKVLENFLSEPVGKTEREIIIDELGRLITNQTERNFAIYWLHSITNAKGKQDDRELKILNDVDARFVKQMHVVKSALREHEEVHNKDGELDVDTFLSSCVRKIKQAVPFAPITAPQYKHIVYVGSIIAMITRADNRISESEVEVMRNYMVKTCRIREETAHEIVKVILSMDIMDTAFLPQVCVELCAFTNTEERLKIMQILFDVSMGDEPLDFDELNRIIHICALLQIPQLEFEQALKAYDAAVVQKG